MAATMDDPIPLPASPDAIPSAAIPAALLSPNPPLASPDAGDNAATPSALPSPEPTHASNTRLVPPITRDPSLPHSEFLAAYIDVFVDNFFGLFQEPTQWRRHLC